MRAGEPSAVHIRVDDPVEKVVDKVACRRKARSTMLRPVAGGGGRIVTDERTSELAIDFIAFCFARRAVGWPQLYDEMCQVAGSRIFRGLGYEELREAGLDFTLGGGAGGGSRLHAGRARSEEPARERDRPAPAGDRGERGGAAGHPGGAIGDPRVADRIARRSAR